MSETKCMNDMVPIQAGGSGSARLADFGFFAALVQPLLKGMSRTEVGLVTSKTFLSKIRYRRLRWLGHVASMDNVRLLLQMMFSTMTGSGARGRPLKSWNEYMRDDLAAIGHAYDWWR